MGSSLLNKVIIVTGASSGIGAAAAIVLAREGANVVITGRNEANLNAVAEKCAKVGKKAFSIKADVTKDDQAADIVNKTIKNFGKLDVLVNNAGILRLAAITDKDAVATFDEVINTNVRAIVVLTHHAVPHLVKSRGNIVNISSVAGSTQVPGHSAYCTSKAAVNHLTSTLASELAPKGVRVNAVSPGPVETPIFERSGSVLTSAEDIKSLTALNRVSSPEEIGEVIAFLVSDKAVSITGSNYVIDCGVLVKGKNMS